MGGRGHNSNATASNRSRNSPQRGRGRGSPSKHVDILDDGDGQWQMQDRKRSRQTTGGHSAASSELSPFRELSIDDKLNRIMSKLDTLDELNESVKSLKVKVDTTISDVCEIKQDIREFDLKMKTLEYKSIDQEARSRRNNLLFWGVPESTKPVEDCVSAVLELVREQLEIDPDSTMTIQRAHRVGQKRARLGPRDTMKPRPIVACFRDGSDVDFKLGNTYKLKDTELGVSIDYPKEINDARKSLWPRFKEAKRDGTKRVFMKYPARLVINDVVVEDCFPNWMHFIRRGYMEGPGFGDTRERRGCGVGDKLYSEVLGKFSVPTSGNSSGLAGKNVGAKSDDFDQRNSENAGNEDD
jgi:hypothetical protein